MITDTGYRTLTDGNGTTVDFSFSWPVQAATDIRVYKVTKATGALGSLLTLNVDYTVALNTVTEGGVITFMVAPTALQQALVYRDMAYTQPDQIPAEGNYPEERIERMVDRAIMLINQLKGAVERSLQLPITSTLTNVSIPVPEAGKPLIGNTTNDGFENGDVDLTELQQALTDANQAATDAQTAQGLAETAQAGAEAAQTAAEAAQTAAEDAAGSLTYANEAEAIAGTEPAKVMSPLRVLQALTALGVLGDGTVGLSNLLLNSDFENWNSGTSAVPDKWTLGSAPTIAREATIKKRGSYSAKLTGTSTSQWFGQQNIHTLIGSGIDYFKGRTVTLGWWVYATEANVARIAISDGVGYSYSPYHTGDSSWQLLTVTRTLSASATGLTVMSSIPNGKTIYFDGAMLVEGESLFAFTPNPSDVAVVKSAGGYYGGIDVTAATHDMVITGLGFTPKLVVIFLTRDDSIYFSLGFATSAADSKSGGFMSPGHSGASTISFYPLGSVGSKVVGRYFIDSSNQVLFEIKSFDSDGFTITQTKTGSPTSNLIMQYFAIG